MSNVNIKEIKDNINAYDRVQYNQSINTKSKSRGWYSEVEIKNEFGETLFTHNELLLSGGIFVLEKMSGVMAPITIKTVNTDLGVNATETSISDGLGIRREDQIFGFMVGTSGSGDVFDTVEPVLYKERVIKELVPFRRIPTSERLTSSEQTMYKLCKTENGYKNYYAKLFEATPTIKVEYDVPGGPAVPANVDETTDGNRVINTYVQYTLKINAKDMREYFKVVGGGINKCRANTVALVHGYKDTTGEYKGVKCVSKFNFNNEAFDNDTKELIILYKIFV